MITVTLPIEDYEKLKACAKPLPPATELRHAIIDKWQSKMRNRSIAIKSSNYSVAQDMAVLLEEAINEALA